MVADYLKAPSLTQVIKLDVSDGKLRCVDATGCPTDADRDDLLRSISTSDRRGKVTLVYDGFLVGDPGTVLARRLNNAEYNYTIRDLTGQDMQLTRQFPVDPANTAGFDNSGESLAMSPALIPRRDRSTSSAGRTSLTRSSCRGITTAPQPLSSSGYCCSSRFEIVFISACACFTSAAERAEI